MFKYFLMESVVWRCFVKKVFLEILQNSQENTCAKVSFLIKPQACNFIKKETLTQVFSCKFCEISRNTFFHRTPLVAAFVLIRFFYNVNLLYCKDRANLITSEEVFTESKIKYNKIK